MTGQEALSLVDTLLHSANPEQRLTDIQSVVLQETWAGRSYREIAQQLGYQHDYIKQVGSQLWRSLSQTLGEPVSKRNLQAVLRRYQLSQQAATTLPVIQCKQDWGEAPDVSRFYGRQGELQTLETWILENGCRAIGIFGLGGMGKTALSVKFAQQVQSQFDFVIWRSLQQAPSLSALLSDILPILSGSEVTTDSSINTLMKQLRSKRCLLVLDNVESILQDGNRGGQYQPGYEAYRQLFDRICDEPHQSCLILTGRDKPGGFALREGKNLPVRSLQLQGLSGVDGQQILIAKGLEATESQSQTLVNYLGGNPLALKIAATTVQTLFSGNIQAFLAQGSTVFSDLWDLLDQHFDRLSPLQQQIMYWLAINREGVTPAKLQEEISPKVPWRELLEALESLQARSLIKNERSLIETGNENLTQQPVIIEYVTERFIQTIDREITTGNLNLFRTYALIEAQTQDYGRDAQIQRILHSLTERLLTHFATQAQLEEHLCQILASLRHQTATQTGYTEGNLLNLFCHLKTLHGHQQAVRAIAFSPDGQQLPSSSFDDTLKMWDVQTGECCQSLKGHNSVWSVTFSPNREWFVSASFDQTLELWDIRTEQFYQTLAGHSELIYSLLVASIQLGDEDSARLTAVSGSLDKSIKLWDLQARKCWQTLRVRRAYEGIQELTEAQWTTLKTLGAASRARSPSYS